MRYKHKGLDSTSLSLFISLSFGNYQPAVTTIIQKTSHRSCQRKAAESRLEAWKVKHPGSTPAELQKAEKRSALFAPPLTSYSKLFGCSHSQTLREMSNIWQIQGRGRQDLPYLGRVPSS